MTPARAWTLILTSVAFFMVALDSLVVITALPAMRHDLGADIGTMAWTVNAYTLGAAGIMTAAAVGDRLGRRRVFVFGLSLFTVASAACALAPTAGALIAARAAQGIGGAIVIPLSLTILSTSFPPERRGAVVGIWGGIAGIAVASGPLVGGAVTQGLDWHWIFWINVPIGVLAAAAARVRLAESHGQRRRLDAPALVLVGGGAVAITWALVSAADRGWGDAVVTVGLVAGVATLVAAAAWERRAPAPMLPPRLLRNRGFSAAAGAALLMTAALFAAVFMTAQYLQVALGYSPFEAGVRVLPWTATPLLVAPLAGALSDRVGARIVLAIGLLLQGAGLAWFAVNATQNPSYDALWPPLLLAGLGVSMALPTAPAAALGAVPPAEIGTASGVSSTMQRLGAPVGIAVVSPVFAAFGSLADPASFVAGFRPAIAVAAGVSVIGAAAAVLIPRTSVRDTTQPAPEPVRIPLPVTDL
jgi:EmrB/QacA subfamily drug resistance transporter